MLSYFVSLAVHVLTDRKNSKLVRDKTHLSAALLVLVIIYD